MLACVGPGGIPGAMKSARFARPRLCCMWLRSKDGAIPSARTLDGITGTLLSRLQRVPSGFGPRVLSTLSLPCGCNRFALSP
jgi:hypothetical protein